MILASALQNPTWRIQNGDYFRSSSRFFVRSARNLVRIQVFRVADYDFGFRFEKFRLGDPKWRLFQVKCAVFRSIGRKFHTDRFLGSQITILASELKNSSQQIRNGDHNSYKVIHSSVCKTGHSEIELLQNQSSRNIRNFDQLLHFRLGYQQFFFSGVRTPQYTPGFLE